MKKVFFIFLFFIFYFPLISIGNNNFQCQEVQNGKFNFKGSKYSGLYTNNNELIYVFKQDKEQVHFVNNNYNKVCFYSKTIESIVGTDSKDSNELKLFFDTKYKQSLVILVYLLLLGSLSYFNPNFNNIINPFKESIIALPIILPLTLVVSFLTSFTIKNSFFSNISIAMISLFAIKFISMHIISTLFNIENNFSKTFTYVFKIFNIFFILQVVFALTFNLDIGYLRYLDMFFYLLIAVFSLSTFVLFVKSDKNIRVTHIFYYLCALEILPVLFLKEYYI